MTTVKKGSMNAKKEAAITKHGMNLLAIFPRAKEKDPVKLCGKLLRLERSGAALGLRLCNGPEYRPGEAEAEEARILGAVNALLGNEAGRVPVFVNTDPRGYALKIDEAWMKASWTRLHRDWGGYGIIAPDLTA